VGQRRIGVRLLLGGTLVTLVVGGLAIAAGLPLRAPPPTIAQFGYIKSVTPKGTGFELRFDPALWLEGTTAAKAAREDGEEAFDYYIRNPDKKLLTYRVAANVPVTVVTVKGAVTSTRITVSELAEIVRGRNPRSRPLIERGRRRYLGYWLVTAVDRVRSIDEQYQP
jgi:hypothetical protein